MRVRLTAPAAKAVRLSAKAEKRTNPQQASVMVLRGANSVGFLAATTGLGQTNPTALKGAAK